MIFNTKATQKDASQKLTDFSLGSNKLNELWSELDDTSEAAVSGGNVSLYPEELSLATPPRKPWLPPLPEGYKP